MARCCVWVLSIVLVALPHTPAEASGGGVSAGAAKGTFQLPAGVPLAGFSRRGGEPSSGLHDPVGVRALVVADEATAVALVSCDLLIIDEQLFQAVHERLGADGGWTPDALFIAATHTHSGPGAYGRKFLEKVSMGHFDPAVFDALVEEIVLTVRRAAEQRQPVRMAWRRADASHLIANRIQADGVTDGELLVCAFYGRAAEPLAVLVNFSAHPTTLGAWNRQLSADYPGVIVRTIEAHWPAATVLFFVGAVGDQAPITQGDSYARAEWIGAQLAQRAIAVLQQPEPPQDVRRLTVRQVEMTLPPATLRLGHLRVPRWLSRLFVDDDASLSVIAMDDAVWIGVPCDLTASLGQQLKRAARAQGWQPMVVGFANDYIGYCISESLYNTDTYEAAMAFNGPHAGEEIVERLERMLQGVKAK